VVKATGADAEVVHLTYESINASMDFLTAVGRFRRERCPSIAGLSTIGHLQRISKTSESREMAEEFATRLRALREGAGLTQADLAAKIGISLRAVVQWERGLREPKWGTLVDLADAFGVSVAALRQPKRPAP
jgi:DNA-binding XRE family transcriptional regulator